MDLFLDDEVDDMATRQNVKHFLNKALPRLIMLSGLDSTQLKSPKLSNMPTSKATGNANENKIIKMMEAQRIVKEVVNCMCCCRGYGKIILFDTYVLNLENWKTAQKIGYGQAQYQKFKNQALLDFADTFMCEKDLHVYK